jgi:hypothetical protein
MGIVRVAEVQPSSYCSHRGCHAHSVWEVTYTRGAHGVFRKHYCAEHLPNAAVWITHYRSEGRHER